MTHSIRLVDPNDLTREDLPRVIRPYWAKFHLRDAWGTGTQYHLVDAFYRGTSPASLHIDSAGMLDRLLSQIERGHLIMVGADTNTFDPVVTGSGDKMALLGLAGDEPLLFRQGLKDILTRSAMSRRRPASPEPAAKSSADDFEASVQANNKYFIQPNRAAATSPRADIIPSKLGNAAPLADSAAAPAYSVASPAPAGHSTARETRPDDVDDVYIVMPDVRTQSEKLVTECYGEFSREALKHFLAINPHLRRSFGIVMPAQPIVISPWSHPNLRQQEAEAQQAVAEVQSEYRKLSPEQIAAFQKNHDGISNTLLAGLESQFDTFYADAADAKGSSQTAIAWTAGAATALGAQANGIGNGLKRIEQESIKLHRALKDIPKARWPQHEAFKRFRAFRDAELKKVRSTLKSIPLIPNPLRAAGEKSLKRYAGLNNRYIYRWRNQQAFTMPRQFSTLYSNAMKYSQGFGQAGKGLFVLSAIPKAHETLELCTMDNAEAEACSRSAVRNGVSVSFAYLLGIATTSASTMLLATGPIGWGIAAGLVIVGVNYGGDLSELIGDRAEWLIFDAIEETDL